MINARLKKISAAVYRVTDLMNDEEPMKWSLRRQTVAIMREAALLDNGANFKEKVLHSTAVEQHVNEMFDLLDVASSVSFISQLNYEVLAREYRAFLKTLHVEDEEVSFKANISAPVKPRQLVGGANENKGQASATSPIEKRTPEKRVGATSHAAEEKTDTLTAGAFSQSTKQEKVTTTNIDRQARIVDFLKTNTWASRGDILRIFGSEISEKTLQRELAAMVEARKIVKRGEKRWCRYALNES